MWTNIVNFDKRGNKIPLVKFPKPSLRLAPNFNGISQYGVFSVSLVSGDVLEFEFISPNSSPPSGFYRILSNVSGSSSVFVTLSNMILNVQRGAATLDGVPVTGSTVFPIDGQRHRLVFTATQNDTVVDIGGSSINGGFCDFIIFNLKVNDGSVYNFPMDDGWANNPVMRNTGSGADGTFINMTEAAWVKIQP